MLAPLLLLIISFVVGVVAAVIVTLYQFNLSDSEPLNFTIPANFEETSFSYDSNQEYATSNYLQPFDPGSSCKFSVRVENAKTDYFDFDDFMRDNFYYNATLDELTETTINGLTWSTATETRYGDDLHYYYATTKGDYIYLVTFDILSEEEGSTFCADAHDTVINSLRF